MKKIILILMIIVSLLNTKLCLGQSKSETENWITEKSKEYAINNYYYRELKIEDGYFIYFEKIGETWFYERILIKNISEIQIKKKEDNDWGKYYSIKVFCKTKGCNDSGNYINGLYKNTVVEYLDNKGSVEVFLKENFGQDELQKRMEKALLYLVKLYGGNAKVHKEAF